MEKSIIESFKANLQLGKITLAAEYKMNSR
jgi:hypothetical protein